MWQPVSRTRSAVPWVLAVALALGCGGRAAHEGGGFPERDVLTREDIARTHAVTAYDAVQRLRSHWLRMRGSTQMPASATGAQFQEPEVQVYLDEQRLGNVDNLQRIEAEVVEYIRFVEPAEASSRWGPGNGAGVIFVSTRPMGQNPRG